MQANPKFVPMQDRYKFGDCLVPDGERGPWRISTFTIDAEKNLGVFMNNFRAIRDGHGYTAVSSGTYRRLTHKEHGVVMSNTPMEIRTNYDAYRLAQGRVLINGLGLGMLVEGLIRKDNVEHIKIIEVDADVIALVGPHFKHPKVEIVHADAYAYKPAKDERYGYIWHDIWNDISGDNLPLMAKLTRKWAGRASNGQGVWSREELRAAARRESRRYW